MLLSEALSAADCLICLQPLQATRSTSASQQAGPHQSSSQPDTGASVRARPEGHFQITFAPGALFTSASPTLSATSSGVASNPSPHDGVGCGDECGISLLPCGHLLHSACLMQLLEHQQQERRPLVCPVCRTELSDRVSDIVPFHPRTRPARLQSSGAETLHRPTASRRRSAGGTGVCSSGGGPTTHASRTHAPHGVSVMDTTGPSTAAGVSVGVPHDATSPPRSPTLGEGATAHADVDTVVVDDASRSDSEGVEEGVTLVATRQVPLSEVYRRLLKRIAEQLRERTTTLHQREHDLRASRQRLEQDTAEVEASVTDMERRCDVLGGGDGSGGVSHSSFSEERRRQALLRVCMETKAAWDAATLELAASVREAADLQRTLDSYARKTARLRGRGPE